MKSFPVKSYLTAFVLIPLCFAAVTFGQSNISSASVSRSRAVANSTPASPTSTTNTPPTYNASNPTPYNPPVTFSVPEEVAVEEFVNYHKHRLPVPKVGQAVAMDVRWGNDQISSTNGEAVLQIGLATAEVSERTDLRPLNLALVIDKSGSMAASDKMLRVKSSLHTMIGRLRPDDIVSIVVFDTQARVLCPAGGIGDGYAIRNAIDGIIADGSTNLHGGLMLGYKEAMKNFRKGATNRVIMLTDGIANVGTTSPSDIARESSEFNGQGIDLSTIGVGMELNNDLLRTLAKSGRGLYHFVADSIDIEKVFITELQSLISQAARQPELTVENSSGLTMEKIYGYTPRIRANGASISLENMNNGLTQVVMMKFRSREKAGDHKVKVKFSYFDVAKQRIAEEVQEITLRTTGQKYCELLLDTEVKKNFTIAQLAQSLFDMREAVKAGRFNQGEALLDTSVSQTYSRYPNMEDKDISFMLGIIEDYRTNLKSYNRSRSKEDCGRCN